MSEDFFPHKTPMIFCDFLHLFSTKPLVIFKFFQETPWGHAISSTWGLALAGQLVRSRLSYIFRAKQIQQKPIVFFLGCGFFLPRNLNHVLICTGFHSDFGGNFSCNMFLVDFFGGRKGARRHIKFETGFTCSFSW